MTREEQISIASCAYGSRGSSIDFTVGAKWADSNPKSPWISVEDDLPCNHKELIDPKDPNFTVEVIVRWDDGFVLSAIMAKNIKGEWKWIAGYDFTHWMPIPELPKE